MMLHLTDKVHEQQKIKKMALVPVAILLFVFVGSSFLVIKTLKADPRSGQVMEKSTADSSRADQKNYQHPSSTGETYPAEKTVNGMTLVLIPGGTFDMGDTIGDGEPDEQPAHPVILSDFYMGKTEVTVGQFRQFVEATGFQTDAEKQGWAWAWTGSKWEKVEGASWRNPGFAQGDDHPVVSVNWYDANEFCKWAGCRLPTEAEWEYAARNKGQAIKYSWGNAKPAGKQGGNVADESARKKNPDWKIFEGYDDGYIFTAPVASYDANVLGLVDMTGNVWEWCFDWYDPNEYKSGTSDVSLSDSPRLNPRGPASGTARVIRGGSWNSDERNCRLSFRGWSSPGVKQVDFGFRVAHDLLE